MIIEAAPDLLDALRAYAKPFSSHPPAILRMFNAGGNPIIAMPDGSAVPLTPEFPSFTPFPFSPDSDRGLGIILLAAALHRPSGRLPFGSGSARLVSALYSSYDIDIFRLNRMPFEPLRALVDAYASESDERFDEDERARIPGILRSVCDFFYRVGPLTTWLESAPDWETRAGELSQEIYWMGARSKTRTKARLFLWLVCQVPGYGVRREQASRFAWPVGDGHMRFLFDILKPPRGGRAGATPPPEARAEAFTGLAHAAFPEQPWSLYQPLDAFLKPDGQGGMVCRTVQGGCRPCPLSARCPAAKHFMMREVPREGEAR